jgi:membrane-associated phospholipid phosphatase
MITLINLWWKISLHSVGAGALIGLVLMLSLKMLTPLDWYLISVIIAGGLILSSRLKLNLHSPQQVWVGLFAGFFGLTASMMLFQKLI